MLLSVKDIHVYYGLLEAVKGVSVGVTEKGIVALIGANGAGKSTILRAISGLNRPKSGEIWFQDRRIDKLSPQDIVKLGIGHVPEGKRLFGEMSVQDNLLMGAYLRRDWDEIKQTLEEVYAHFPILEERRKQSAATLSGGEQQMLAIGRALMSAPKLLLLDEPSMGLSPLMGQEIVDIISTLHESKIGIILVEQNAELALDISTRCYVIELGRITLEGESAKVRNDENVKKAYLGM
jgi:branched-chain amino acid transport system ATP-binding protein